MAIKTKRTEPVIKGTYADGKIHYFAAHECTQQEAAELYEKQRLKPTTTIDPIKETKAKETVANADKNMPRTINVR